jgi:hypothetical protein
VGVEGEASVGVVGGVVIGVGDELDAAVGAGDDGVPGQVELGVVVPAHRDQVVERGGAAAAPVLAVVAVAPGPRSRVEQR